MNVQIGASTKRSLGRAALVAINAVLILALVLTGTLGNAPSRNVYQRVGALPATDALLYHFKPLNVKVLDANNSLIYEGNGGAPSNATILNSLSGVRGGQTAITQATVEGTARAEVALAKTDTSVVSGAAVSYQVPLIGLTGTMAETSPGVYSVTLTDKVVVTPDFTGLSEAEVRGWQLQPLDYALNAKKMSSTAVNDQISGLGITDSVNATVEIPFDLFVKARLLDANGQPIANRTLSARVQAPNHAYAETVTIATGADGVFTYQRREKVVITATGGSIAQLAAPVQLGDGSPSVLAFWWSDDGDWHPWEWLSARFGRLYDPTGIVGDPINVTTGNMYDARQDLLIPGRGLPLQFARFYNSQDDYSGPLGYGWTHSYNSFLKEQADGGVTQTDPQGAQVRFKRNDDGSYTAPAGNRDTLTKAADGSYRLDKKNGIVWHFDAAGKLQRIVDPNGNAIVLGYTDGRLTTITDTVGRATRLAYDANGRLTSLTDPAGRVVKYGYDGSGNLTAVTDPLGLVTRYAYDGSTRNLTQITEAWGEQITFTYDGKDRATSSSSNNGAQKIELLYNKTDSKTLVKDSKGNESTFYYNGDGRITRIVDPTGQALQYTWDADGNKVGSTDQLRNTTRLSYDARGNVTALTDPLGNVSTLTYGPASRLASITDPGGGVTRYGYDAAGNLTVTTDAAGNGMTFAYDATGQLTGVTDPRGNTTAFSYDAHGNLVTVADPLGNTTRFAYDLLGRPVSQTDALGRVTRTEYDANGRVVAVTRPDGLKLSLTYDAAGNVTSVTDAAGRTTRAEYDVHKRPVRTIDALGNTTQFTYDTEGKPTTVTDPLGNVTRFEYDALTRPTKVVRPDGASVVYGYDAAGRRTQATDPNGAVTQFRYDAAGRLSGVSDPLGGSASFLYNWAGQITQATNPNGHATVYAYDGLNRLVKVTDALGNASAFQYDAAGNVTRRTDANGAITTYTYDAAGQLTRVAYPDGKTVDHAYDAAGRLTGVTDANGAFRFGYDLLDRLVEEALPDGRALRHEYDAVGNRTALTDPLGGITRYQYDAGDRMVALTDRDAQTTSYSYDALGRPTKIAYPTGAGVNYAYDGLGRVTSVTNTGGRGQVLAGFSYTYDKAGNPIAVVNAAGATTNYSYDALGRLLREAYPDGRTQAYTYDAAGNRVSQTTSSGPTATPVTTNYSYDVAEQMVQAGPYRYSYDKNGNLVSRSDGTTTTTFGYDAEGRLTSAGDARYAYDFAGRLISAQSGGETRGYVYDGQVELLESDEKGPLAYYTRGPGDQLVARHHLVQGQKESYYHFDGAGNTVALSGATGGLQAGWEYDAFGNVTEEQRRTWLNPFTFAGNRYDEGTDLYYFHARWYDAAAGRFISPDPVAGFGVMPQTLNPYVYGLNNPLRFVDAGGAFPPLVAAMLVGAAIGGVLAAGEYYLTHDKGSFDWGEFWFSVGVGAVVGSVEEVAFLGMGKFIRAARIGSRMTPALGQAVGSGGRYVDDAARAGANACANSFSADTPVATETGQRPISEVALGDRVLAWDEGTDSIGYYPVTDLIRHEDPEVYYLAIESPAGGIEELVTTREHPFYTAEQGWTEAGELWPGAQVRRADGTQGVVRSGRVVQDPQRMYNLTVDEAHTFFVGAGQWLVHNTGPCKVPNAFNSGRPPHTADVTVRSSTGETVASGTLRSGGMTADEAALGFPQSTLATHTEARAVNQFPLRKGDTMVIEGQYPPCPSCKGKMNSAARESGADIIYRWDGKVWRTKR